MRVNPEQPIPEKAMLEELKNRGFLQGDVDDMMKHFLGAVFQPHGTFIYSLDVVPG